MSVVEALQHCELSVNEIKGKSIDHGCMQHTHGHRQSKRMLAWHKHRQNTSRKHIVYTHECADFIMVQTVGKSLPLVTWFDYFPILLFVVSNALEIVYLQ
jgi:hypothetical protein